MPLRPETVLQTLTRGIASLSSSSDSARADAQLLLAHSLDRDREWLVAHDDDVLTRMQVERFKSLCDRRSTGEPIAYILGSAWFYGREFQINDAVLVPRRETEHLVDEAIAHLRASFDPNDPAKPPNVLDVGVGSGAIACTIAAEVRSALVDGTDMSASALKVAEQNARRFDVIGRCTFMHGDLTAPLGRSRLYDVVVANLPYVPSAEIGRLPDPVSFEPREALDGGQDGLDYYRRLLPLAPSLLRPGALLLFEAAPASLPELERLAREVFPGGDIEVCADYAGLPRYIRILSV